MLTKGDFRWREGWRFMVGGITNTRTGITVRRVIDWDAPTSDVIYRVTSEGKWEDFTSVLDALAYADVTHALLTKPEEGNHVQT